MLVLQSPSLLDLIVATAIFVLARPYKRDLILLLFNIK